MVASLWKSVNELESYAKEAEYGCLKLKQVLEPMAFLYEEDLPQVPESSSLEAYPLDYEDPERKLLHCNVRSKHYLRLASNDVSTNYLDQYRRRHGERKLAKL